MAAQKRVSRSSVDDATLSHYFSEIQRFPFLEREEEYQLAKRSREHEDTQAAQKLATSHLRLVVRVAMGYRGYGLPIGEIISEGNAGLMQAIERFEPERDFRLATYATWWIRASIQEYILRSWSLVKIGTTAGQKKLFFNLRKVKARLHAYQEGDLKPDQVEKIAGWLRVTEQEVVEMNRRLAGDVSLNVRLRNHPHGAEEMEEWQDVMEDSAESPESTVMQCEEASERLRALETSLGVLNARELRIFRARRLQDEVVTLEALGDEFGVSRERIRQIEIRALEKIQAAVIAEVDGREKQYMACARALA